jgi:thiol-disulfide isomerase/thioredoxin
MKKIILVGSIILLAILVFNSQKNKISKLFKTSSIKSLVKKTANTMAISGSVINHRGKIYLQGPSNIHKTIPLNKDGSFSYILDIEEVGEYAIYTENQNSFYFYVASGLDINIKFDDKKFEGSLKFNGKGAGVAKYLILKQERIGYFWKDREKLFAMSQTGYMDIMKSNKAYLKRALEKIEGAASRDFKILESREIEYYYLQRLDIYKSNIPENSNIKTDPIEQEILKQQQTIGFVYDNETDFNFSTFYQKLVNKYYREKIWELSENNANIDYNKAFFTVVKEIKSEKIRNAQFNDIESLKLEDVDSYYKNCMEILTDKRLRAKITQIYDTVKEKAKTIVKGKPSPKFDNYENYAGGTTSLDDLKGKYVYIDVWATWCIPCIAEIPDLKKLEKAYHGKNIAFVSISVDKLKNRGKWREMIADKALKGIQLLADKAFDSDFIMKYYINGIPTFILLDPQGNIVEQDAPRPSNTKVIKQLFDKVLKK